MSLVWDKTMGNAAWGRVGYGLRILRGFCAPGGRAAAGGNPERGQALPWHVERLATRASSWFIFTGEPCQVENLSAYAKRPIAFFARYVRRHGVAHAVILTSVALAVLCSVVTQYGVKYLVDTLSQPQSGPSAAWIAFSVLVSLIAADNLLWRLASWIGNSTFVAVTGDVRRELFRHLTGQAPGYFSSRSPATLTSRITATSNALFTVENMLVWNVLPPCMATVCAIGFVATVSWGMAASLVVAAGIVVGVMFLRAAAGKPLHHEFANRAAVVDGEMTDVVGNLNIVKAFGGLVREHRRFDRTVEKELNARVQSLRYLERLRLTHAVVTVTLTIALLAWAIWLWQRKAATTGDVILVCTLGLAVLHATRDLAVALVDVTQHLARFSEALSTLLVAHQMCDYPGAATLVRRGASVTFEDVTFAYPDCPRIFEQLSFHIGTGQRVGLVGASGGGKSTLLALVQRFYDIQTGRILVNDQDITLVTQQSLREAIAVVPQDISLFHRTLLENIRYARPEASDEEVREAAACARCCDFIEKLPDGLETLVGDRGLRLSGGQRQRIAIARAFLKNAPLLLLDEATSALDGESEELIREALERLLRGRTVIAIAHRLSSVRNFDRIFVLEGGRLIEDGPPDALLRGNGPYRKLIESEMGRLANTHPRAA
jgi:ATP-binding cassette, subfamily B, bacterial